MRLIMSPADIPKGTAYGILGKDKRTTFLREILTGVRPDLHFTGFKTDLEGLGDGVILISQPDWPKLIETAQQNETGNTGQLLVMPIPEGDPWSYWEFSKRVHGTLGEVRTLSEGELEDILGPNEGDTSWTHHYMRFNAGFLKEHQDRISFVMGHLADEESAQVYIRILTGEPKELWRHYASNSYGATQYFDRQLLTLEEGNVVLNGGIHNGFEIPFFTAMVGSRGKVFNLDPYGFDFLSDYTRENIRHFEQVIEEHRIALWDSQGEVSLYVDDGEQVLGREAKQEVQGFERQAFPCTSIDGFVAQEGLDQLDLIKLDLEGAESRVVVGMAETLKVLRPSLAVSIYHSINHFWDIPMYMMNLCEDYSFFIRNYSSQLEETILYAIPRERLPS